MFISKVEKNTIFAELYDLRKTVKELQVKVNAMQANIMTLNLGRPVQIVAPPKKRGRPFGSKNKEKA